MWLDNSHNIYKEQSINKPMDLNYLENLGLSNNESKIYLALLELGSVTANKIAEKAGIHRRTVYDILEMLIEKGLASYIIEANKKYYQAESPERLLNVLEEKEKNFKKILPELMLKRKLSKAPQEINVFRGKKAVQQLAEDMLSSKISYSFGSSGKFKEVLGETYYINWLNKIKQKRNKLKIILSKKKLKEKFPENVEIRYIQEDYILPSSTTIFEDKVLILIFAEQPVGILMRSKEISKAYLKYFELLWSLAVKS